MPIVSVVIPVFNGEKYIDDCLQSVLKQCLSDIEIICVDDGSTDDSLSILRRYEKEDPRVKVLYQENQYAGAARNVGMSHAKGKYIYFLDVDDYIEYDMFDEMVKTAECNHLDILICQYRFIDNLDGSYIDRSFDLNEQLLPEKDVFCGKDVRDSAIFQLTTGVAWDKLYNFEFVKKSNILFQELRTSNDGFFSYCHMSIAKRIGYLKKKFVNYRTNNENSLSGTRTKSWETAFYMLEAIRDELQRRNCYVEYEKSFLNYAMTHLIGYLESINSYDEYARCYKKMKDSELELFHIMEHDKEYYYDGNCYEKYASMNSLSVEEYLFNEGLIWRHKLKKRSWVFPFNKIKRESFIAIYGAGNMGRAYYGQIVSSGFTNRVLWVDKNHTIMNERIHDPNEIMRQRPDYVVIAVDNDGIRSDIVKWLISCGVDQKTIIA